MKKTIATAVITAIVTAAIAIACFAGCSKKSVKQTATVYLDQEEKAPTSHYRVLDEKRGLGGKWATFFKRWPFAPKTSARLLRRDKSCFINNLHR